MQASEVEVRVPILTSVLLMLMALGASANYLGDIESNRGDFARMAHDELVTVSFSYKVDDPAGARMRIIPMTNGAYTPYAAWQGSPIFPEGESTGSLYFTVTDGDVKVDQIGIYMFSEDWSETLLEFFIPVDYRFSSKGINNLVFSHTQPSWLQYADHLYIDHDFASDEPGKLFVRPFYQGSIVSDYGASGGEDITPPYDSGAHDFTIFSGPSPVDALRFQLKSLDLTEVLWEDFIPVNYNWDAHGLYNLGLDWDSNQYLSYGQYVSGTFDYSTDDANGVRIFCLGARDNEVVWTHINPQGSVLMPAPSGHDSRWFRYMGDQDINQVCFKMTNEDQSETYLEAYVPLDIHYRAHAVNQVTLTPGAPAILDYDEHIYTSFYYHTTGVNDLRIWNYGYAQGIQVGNTSGSPLYPAPAGMGTNRTGYEYTSPGLVDQILFDIYDEIDAVLVEESWAPAFHFYGTSAVATQAPEEAPALTKLMPNFPNPFNPKTTLSFNMAQAGQVKLAVFDVQGRLVKVLVDEHKAAGPHAIEWDGTDAKGERMTSGVYLSKFLSGEHEETRKMILLK